MPCRDRTRRHRSRTPLPRAPPGRDHEVVRTNLSPRGSAHHPGQAPSPLPRPCCPGLGEADQERSSLDHRMVGAAADPERSLRVTVIGSDVSRSWNESLVPRSRFAIHRTRKNTSLTCRSTEPPIGIEPMTYALRGGLEPSTAVQAVTSALLAWLLSPPVSVPVQGRC